MARARPVKAKKVTFTVRCTEQEAQQIREEAHQTHRTIGALMLHATLERINSNHPGRHEYPPLFGIRKPH